MKRAAKPFGGFEPPPVNKWHSRIAVAFGAMTWFWMMYRAKQDGDVLLVSNIVLQFCFLMHYRVGVTLGNTKGITRKMNLMQNKKYLRSDVYLNKMYCFS